MGKLDLKLLIVIFAFVLLVTLLDDADASRRRSSLSRRRATTRRRTSFTSSRRRTSFSSTGRRRSSYGSSRSTSSSSSGLVIGLSIFGSILFLVVIGFVIGYCCCKSSRRNATGSIISTPPEVQYQTVYQTGSAGQPPPYSASTDDAYPYPTKNDVNPLPGETTAYPAGLPPAVLPYPAAAYPPNDSAMGETPVYPPPGDSAAAYSPPSGIQPPQGFQPQPGIQPPLQGQVTTLPGQSLSSGQESTSYLPPPSYDDVLKESQPGTQTEAIPQP